MKYLKLYESWLSKKIDNYQIHEICKQYGIKNYTINPDGSIDVDGVYLSIRDNTQHNKFSMEKLPLKFNKVNIFDCENNKLISFEGSPKEVNKFFNFTCNKLTSFKFAPKIIRGNFWCNFNNIKSFEYFPSYVGGYFGCDSNPIEEVWDLVRDTEKIELLNDFDIFRDEDTDTPIIIMDRLNDFLLTIGKKEVKEVDQYKNI